MATKLFDPFDDPFDMERWRRVMGPDAHTWALRRELDHAMFLRELKNREETEMAAKKAAAKRKAQQSSELQELLAEYFGVREERLELERQVADSKKVEKELEAEVVNILGRQGLDRVDCSHGSFTVRESLVRRAEDWPAIWAWIGETGNFEVLERRLHQSHIVELVENTGHEIPGTHTERIAKVTARAKK